MVSTFKFGFGGDDIDEDVGPDEIESGVLDSPELSQSKEDQKHEGLSAKSVSLDDLVGTLLLFLVTPVIPVLDSTLSLLPLMYLPSKRAWCFSENRTLWICYTQRSGRKDNSFMVSCLLLPLG